MPETLRQRSPSGPPHRLIVSLLGFLLTFEASGEAQSLRPSAKSLRAQIRAAAAHDFTYLRNASHVKTFVRMGWLVPVRGNRDYRLADVSFPYARPALRTFLERLSQQYRAACKEVLIVTSLTRPKSHQPGNASRRSVHPTGMAADLRRSHQRSCRQWIERVLLSLEGKGVLEASRERRPPHYHVAVFPRQYLRYVDLLNQSQEHSTYRVRPGDSLWKIARRYRTTVRKIKSANGLRSSEIYPGQVLKIPSPD